MRTSARLPTRTHDPWAKSRKLGNDWHWPSSDFAHPTLQAQRIKAWMALELGCSRVPEFREEPQVGNIRLAVTSPAMTALRGPSSSQSHLTCAQHDPAGRAPRARRSAAR